MTLAEHHRLTQILLEHHRRDPDDEDAEAQYRQAATAREIAWLNHGASFKPRGLL